MAVLRQTVCERCGVKTDTEESRFSSKSPEGWGEVWVEHDANDIDMVIDLCDPCMNVVRRAIVEALKG